MGGAGQLPRGSRMAGGFRERRLAWGPAAVGVGPGQGAHTGKGAAWSELPTELKEGQPRLFISVPTGGPEGKMGVKLTSCHSPASKVQSDGTTC